jgi:purine-binding chemotaxis protein CheW
MDFLEIRRKAKERAAGEAAEGSDAQAPATPSAETPPAPAPASGATGPADAGPVLKEADVTAGKLAAELQGLPAEPELAREEAPAGEADARFTTWRPGTGERPFVPAPEPVPAPTPTPIPAEPVVTEAAEARPGPPPEDAPARRPAAASSRPPAHRGDHPGRRSAAQSPVPAPRDPLDDFFYRADEELSAAVALPADAEPEEDAREDAGLEEYLTFLLGAEEFAVAIERVREVLKSQVITEVPRAPAGILGVVTVRGEVVAVFDPRRRLGLPGQAPEAGSGRIVIVDDGEGPCGLLVDAVASVVRLERGSIEPTPQGIGGAAADCLAGIGREEQRLFTVLDLAALLRRGAPAPRSGRDHAGA